jgi:hypothetical protein
MDDSNDSIMSHLYVTRDSKLHTFVIMFKGNFNFNISISIPQGTNDTDDQPYPNKISYDSFVEGVETDPNSANYGTPKGDAISLQDTPISATPITMNNSIGIIK